MRILLTMALLLGLAGSALAQQDQTDRPGPDATSPGVAGSNGCWPMVTRDRVVVELDQGPARTGTLLCMGPEEIMLAGSGTLPLSGIRQITKPRDSVLDGVLKGAAVGLVILAFCVNDCQAEYVLRATLAYATIGGVIDGLQGNNKTIYRREPRPAIGFKVRF